MTGRYANLGRWRAPGTPAVSHRHTASGRMGTR